MSPFCLLQKIFFPSSVVDTVKVFALLSVLAALPADRRSRSGFGSALPELAFEVLLLVIQTGSFLLYKTIKKLVRNCTYLASHTNALDFAPSFSHFDHANTCIFWTSFPLAYLCTLLVVLRIAVEALEELIIVLQNQTKLRLCHQDCHLERCCRSWSCRNSRCCLHCSQRCSHL